MVGVAVSCRGLGWHLMLTPVNTHTHTHKTCGTKPNKICKGLQWLCWLLVSLVAKTAGVPSAEKVTGNPRNSCCMADSLSSLLLVVTTSQLCWSLLRCNWSRSFMWSLKGWGRQWLTLLSFLARETLSSWKFPLCTEHWPLGNGMVQGKTEATLPSLCLFLFPRVLFYCAPEVFKVNSCNHPELFLLADHCLMIDLCRGTLIFVGQSPTLSSQHRFLIFLL